MALIICVDCGKKFSSRAKACPSCGGPPEPVVANGLMNVGGDDPFRADNTLLSQHQLCPSCGWLGQLTGATPTYTGTKVAGTTAAVGGTGVAAAGVAGMGLGTVLLLAGLAANILGALCFATLILAPVGLVLEVVGLILDAVGLILLFTGGAAAGVGTTVAVGGAVATSHAHHAANAARLAAAHCPVCNGLGLIPGDSPMAQQQYENIPSLRERAHQVSEAVLIQQGEIRMADTSDLPMAMHNQKELEGVATDGAQARSEDTPTRPTYAIVFGVATVIALSMLGYLNYLHTPGRNVGSPAVPSAPQTDPPPPLADSVAAPAAPMPKMGKARGSRRGSTHGGGTRDGAPAGLNKTKERDPFEVQK